MDFAHCNPVVISVKQHKIAAYRGFVHTCWIYAVIQEKMMIYPPNFKSVVIVFRIEESINSANCDKDSEFCCVTLSVTDV